MISRQIHDGPSVELRKRISRLAPIMAAVTTLFGVGGCAVSIGTASCEGKPMNVHRSSGTRSDVVAKSWVECTHPVNIDGYIEIQRKDREGRWYTYKRTNVNPFTTIPDFRHVRQAASQCAPGTFRNKTFVRAIYKGTAKSTTDYSATTTNPCA
jgi:hypothetical protein